MIKINKAIGANLATDFSAIQTTPAEAQAITSITTGGVYTPTPSADLLSGWDFTVGFGTLGTISIDDADSFTSTGNGGVEKIGYTVIGNYYELTIAGATTATDLQIWNAGYRDQYGADVLSGGGTTIYFTAIFDTGLYLRNNGTGTTDIITFTLKSLGPASGYLIPAGLGDVVDGDSNLLPIGQGQTVSIDTDTGWTDGSVPLLGVDFSDASASITTGSMIPTEPPATWTISDNSIVGPFVEIGNDLELINSGTLTENTNYFVNTTELNNFGTGVVQYEYFTSDGTEACDANNTVYQVDETGIQWNGLGSAAATQAGILTLGGKHKLVHILTRTAGTNTVNCGTTSGTARSSSDTFTEYLPCNGDTSLDYVGDASFAGEIVSTDLSAQQVSHNHNLKGIGVSTRP